MKLIPLYDRVVLKTLPQKAEKIGNIILPEITKKPEISEVVAIGEGIIDGKEVTFKVKIGDHVIFNKFTGNEFKLDNETYTKIKEKDILAIIDK